MLKFMLMIPVVLLIGCTPALKNSADAICSGTVSARNLHTSALLADGGPRSLVTGDALIALLDAGCL